MSPTVEELLRQYEISRPHADELRSLEIRHRLGEGQNPKFSAVTADGARVIKFCQNNVGRVPEICEREAMTFLFGRLLGVPVVDSWVVPAEFLNNVPVHQNADNDLILDRFVLMRLVQGSTFQDNPSRAAWRIGLHHQKVADMLAFLHWLGDEDRGLTDIMYEGRDIVLIDNGLCGPGNNDKLRGYHPYPEHYDQERITKKCYGGGKRSLVAFLLRDLEFDHQLLSVPHILERIRSLDASAIRQVCKSCHINDRVPETLIQRSKTIEEDYDAWFEAAVRLCRSFK